MDLMPGYLSRMICHRFDLPSPVFRGSKGRIGKKLLLQQLWRPYRIHTPLVSANAVIMWCMECIWTSNHMRLLNRAPVCLEGEGSTSLLHLHKSLFVPFSVLFLGQVDSMAVYVFVVCMCGVVWRGFSLFLSGSSRGWW
jgi:hypothetical protein